MSEKMNELFTLTQKAQKMEMINEEIALDLYIEIFENYTPKISKTYESAIRLLEKRHRFEEALKICNLAIDLIKEDQISGILVKFQQTQARLMKKMEETKPPVPVKKKPPYKMIGGIFALVVITIVILAISNPYDDLNVNLEGKESLPGGENGFNTGTEETPPEAEYPITENMITTATNEGQKYHDITGVSITPQEGTIGIGIMVSAGTDDDRSKYLAEQVLKALSGAASATYKDLDAPSGDYLGQIYDYYELVISVGTGPSDEEIIAKGTKNKTSSDIYWR